MAEEEVLTQHALCHVSCFIPNAFVENTIDVLKKKIQCQTILVDSFERIRALL